MNIATWLRQIGLERYERAFSANDITVAILPNLSDADLKEIGVTSLGHRKILLRGIAELSEFSSGIHNHLPSCATPTAERRQLTVMFVDIVGSTALSLRLDPEDMQKVLHQYRGAVASAPFIAEPGLLPNGNGMQKAERQRT
jgi:hypothetical protein